MTAALVWWAHRISAVKWPRAFSSPAIRFSRAEGAAAVVAIAVCYVRFAQIIRSPDAISQGIDAPFHVNLVRLILDNQEIGPFISAKLISSAQVYPPLWHGVAALIVQMTGASIPLASNALNGAVVAVAWPLSVLALTRCLTGARAAALIPAAFTTAAAYAFPWTPIQGQWSDVGALFPFTMSTSILPVVIPLVARMFGFLRESFLSRSMASIMLAATMAALAMSQPSGVAAAGAICGSLITALLVRRFVWELRARSPFVRHLRLLVVGLLFGVAFFTFWILARPTPVVGWGAFTDPWRAFAGALLNAPLNGPVPWVTALASLAGLIVALALRCWWFVAPYIGMLYIYLVGAASGNQVFRAFTIGAWWGDNERTAAMLPMFTVACVGLSAGAMAAWVGRQRSERSWNQPALAESTMTALVAVPILLGALVFPGERPHDPARATSFGVWATSPILTSDELTLLGRLDRFVPVGSVIANDPWDGSSMAYALTDRKVLFPHAYLGADPERVIVASSLHDAEPGSAVCRALGRLHAQYALDFGGHLIDPYRPEIVDFSGFQGLSESKSFQLLDSQGSARLYKIVGCNYH
ncbi:hypothetical protein L0M17_05055 [Sinomonas sp. 5-5]|uniref:Glycosyltransferase RgtA/B/C/D-like domain-containing protein n=1 Tax=Sinomonas terrae TaxID=2908838 RepID=A0ABS9TY57_9MICC|nr:hypothetical protein [Sinomonas terrae]